MYEHVKTGCKHIPPCEQPLQFQSGYFLNKPHTLKLGLSTLLFLLQGPEQDMEAESDLTVTQLNEKRQA